MLARLARVGLAILVLGTAMRGAVALQRPAALVVAGIGPGAVPIEGTWAFHTGDNPAWAAPGFDDSAWERLTAAQPWGRQGHPEYHGFAWYRKGLDLRAAPGQSADFRLLLPEVDQAYEVYWNGELVGRCGNLPPHPRWFYSQRPHVFALTGNPAGVLALRVWNAPPLSDEDPGLKGGFAAMPLVGTATAIGDAKAHLDYNWLRGHQFAFSENLLFAMVGLFSFLAWLRNRKQPLLFWMTGFTLSPALLLLCVHARIPIPYTVSMSLDQPLIAVRDISVWYLLLYLLDLSVDVRVAQLTKALAAISLAANVLDGAMVALAWHPRLSRAMLAGDAFTTTVNTLLELYPLVLVALAVIRRKRLDIADMAVAVSAFVLEMVHVARDAAGQGKRFTHWTLSGRIDNPILTLNGSAISLVDALEVLLFLCLVWAVYRSFFQERQRQLEMKQELKSAQELQRVLVPDAVVDLKGFHVTSAYRPAQEVGGDFFQILPAGDAILAVVGDVSGKGVKAALAVSFLLGMLRTLTDSTTAPGVVLRELNQRMAGRIQGGFTTCVAVRVEPDGQCRIASAGHPGPLIDGYEMEIDGALPLGVLEGTQYPETAFALLPGQTCALYTDGVLEARSPSGELYGYGRVAELFRGRPTAEQAADAAIQFGQDDDITVVSITRLAGQPPAPRELQFDAGETAVAG